MLKYFETLDSKVCCGCRACEQVCAKQAISIRPDEEGFLYPVLDTSTCVDCGLCSKVCPMENTEQVKQQEGKPFIAQNMVSDDLKTSSSGGGFISIAKYVIALGGVVFGAQYTEGCYVAHQKAETIEELEAIKGSKYVQSDTNDAYKQVKDILKTGRLVYFTGTPCQVAGLMLFLGKDYENLLTSDLICHGTPSPTILKKVVDRMETKIGGRFAGYSFRDKRVRGWNCSSSSSYVKPTGNKIIYVNYSKEMEAYFNAFISGDLMRMNCYQCPFANTQRVSDFTLADYWDVRKTHPDFPNIHKGVSLFLINNAKGEKLWNAIKDKFYSLAITIEQAKASNANLVNPTPLKASREESYKLAFTDFDSFVFRYYKGNYIINNLKIQAEYAIRKYTWLFTIVSSLKRLVK